MIVRFSEQAILDLDKVWFYGFTQFGDIQADQYTSDLKRRIDLLEHHPALGRLLTREPHEMRSFVFQQTVVIYTVTDEFVNVDRISDGRRDVESLIEEIIR